MTAVDDEPSSHSSMQTDISGDSGSDSNDVLCEDSGDSEGELATDDPLPSTSSSSNSKGPSAPATAGEQAAHRASGSRAVGVSRGGPPSSQYNPSTVWAGNVCVVRREDTKVTWRMYNLLVTALVLSSSSDSDFFLWGESLPSHACVSYNTIQFVSQVCSWYTTCPCHQSHRSCVKSMQENKGGRDAVVRKLLYWIACGCLAFAL